MKEVTLNLREFGKFDLVVIGGGCTGTFAAVRAARLGAKVAIVERGNCLGGVSTQGLVNVWHSLHDTEYREQIIAGLTQEVVDRLDRTGSVIRETSEFAAFRFDPNALKPVLDELVTECGITVFFHTSYASCIRDGDRCREVIVCNKDGIGTIAADFFIDASGDGDLCRDMGLERYQDSILQPPSACYFLRGAIRGSIADLINAHGAEFDLDDDWGWSGDIPGFRDDLTFRADYHIFGADCSRASDLSRAEMEGRRKAFAFAEALRKYDNPECRIAAMCSAIGIRETVHYRTRFQADELSLLTGASYEDTIMRGTYRVDVHHAEDNGITFKYLDGRTVTNYGKAERSVFGNWREEMGITTPAAKYYQIPFSILVQDVCPNLIPAGRMVNADRGAFGALRVMVNLNQLGEAAGTAAWLALDGAKSVGEVSGADVRRLLVSGGSIL